MKDWRSVEADCYSGGRAEERPLQFRSEGRWIQVARWVRQWREPDADFFLVEDAAGDTTLLRRNADGSWSAQSGAAPSC